MWPQFSFSHLQLRCLIFTGLYRPALRSQYSKVKQMVFTFIIKWKITVNSLAGVLIRLTEKQQLAKVLDVLLLNIVIEYWLTITIQTQKRCFKFVSEFLYLSLQFIYSFTITPHIVKFDCTCLIFDIWERFFSMDRCKLLGLRRFWQLPE